MWDSIKVGLIRLLLLIDSVIYGFVAQLFGLFVDLANTHAFKDEIISNFTNRLYAIIGVVAIFIITYALLQAIVNPDKSTKGEWAGPKLIFNLVLSVVLVALVPVIFNFAYKVQDIILSDDIIGKVFLGIGTESVTLPAFKDENTGEVKTIDASYLTKQRGALMSWNVLNAFLYTSDESVATDWIPPAEFVIADTASEVGTIVCTVSGVFVLAGDVLSFIPWFAGLAPTMVKATGTWLKLCVPIYVAKLGLDIYEEASEAAYDISDNSITWEEMLDVYIKLGNFSPITAWATEIADEDASSDDNPSVTYLPIVSTIVGCILLWMIFSYCLDLGLRAVKLAFYQMIAPIPIFARVLPSSRKIFNNWVKKTLTVYLEVFIRLIIMYAIIYFSSNLNKIDFIEKNLLVKAILTLGIITFAKQAPKLISEITGIDSGNMKLGIMDKLNAGTFGLAGGVIGAATGFVGAGIASRAAGAGFFAGGMAGMANGWKAKGNQFGKQKQTMYKRLGGKGKAGIFGKQSKFDALADQAKNAPLTRAKKRAKNFESSQEFNDAYQSHYAHRYGMTVDELREADGMDVNEIAERKAAQNSVVEASELNIANQQSNLSVIMNSDEYKEFVNSNAAKKYMMDEFKKSGYYDSSKSAGENREAYNRFMETSDAQRLKVNYYVDNGGQQATFVRDTIRRINESQHEINEARAKIATLEKQNAYLEEEASGVGKVIKEEVRQYFIKQDVTKASSGAKDYQDAVRTIKQIDDDAAKAKENANLYKALEKLYQDQSGDKKPNGKDK